MGSRRVGSQPHLRVPVLQTPPKFQETTPKRGRKNENCGGRGKKERNFVLSSGGEVQRRGSGGRWSKEVQTNNNHNIHNHNNAKPRTSGARRVGPEGSAPSPRVWGLGFLGFRKFGHNTETLKLAKVGLEGSPLRSLLFEAPPPSKPLSPSKPPSKTLRLHEGPTKPPFAHSSSPRRSDEAPLRTPFVPTKISRSPLRTPFVPTKDLTKPPSHTLRRRAPTVQAPTLLAPTLFLGPPFGGPQLPRPYPSPILTLKNAHN